MENVGPKLVMQVQWIETVYPVLINTKGESIATRRVTRGNSRVRDIELIQDAYLVHMHNGETRIIHFPCVKEACAKLVLDETGVRAPKEPDPPRPVTKKQQKDSRRGTQRA